ncbi:MAG: hypothetical protein IJ578_05555 [Bacteroidales bacterium]|nr:hypothetical protein [Bacteroidales bacterium]
MKTFAKITCLGVLALLGAACSKASTETLFAGQETRIESFLSSQLSANPDAYTVSNGGSQRLVLVEGSGDELESGGTLSFYWAGYILNSTSLTASSLFGTNSAEVAEAAGWSTEDTDAFAIRTMPLGELAGALRDGLTGVKGGQECIVLFSGKYGFTSKPLGTIPANAALAYHIWVESISND